MTVPVYDRFGVTVYHGDCLEVLAELAGASVDAVVTDPPYGIRFMGKSWDGADIEEGVAIRRAQAAMPEDGKAGRNGGYRSVAAEAGRYDLGANAAFGEWCRQWAVECLRVLKPGGHLLAFGGSRTWHRLTCAVEDAGFEVRDSVSWLYASGFPKSLDVARAIDAVRDDRAEIVNVTTFVAAARKAAGMTYDQVDAAFGTNGMAWRWSTTKHAPAVPSWAQWLKLKELLGFGDEMDAQVWRLNGRKGTPGNERADRVTSVVDRTVYGSGHDVVQAGTPVLADATRWQGWGTALKPAWEPIVVARKPLAGTVASNVLEHGAGALNIDGCRIGTTAPAGRWPTNVVLTHAATPDGVDLCGDGCVPGCPVRELDEQSGDRPGFSSQTDRASQSGISTVYGDGVGRIAPGHREGYNDRGGASRFFPVFRFEAKAPAGERPRVDGVAHPTVKPLALMRWLVRLVTPPGGTVLDPFLGSGTTAQAARAEGFRCIGIEREESYLPLIRARLDAHDGDGDLFGAVS